MSSNPAHTVTFIHTSDFQLGMTRAFLPPDAQSRFSAARLSAVAKLGDIAVERGAEFIVVAGDVFEHNALEPTTHGRALEVLRALPVPVYLLPGNHDPWWRTPSFPAAAASPTSRACTCCATSSRLPCATG